MGSIEKMKMFALKMNYSRCLIILKFKILFLMPNYYARQEKTFQLNGTYIVNDLNIIKRKFKFIVLGVFYY